MTSAQLQASWIAAQQRLDAHLARRDARHHAKVRPDESLGDRIVADRRLPKGASK